MYTAPTPFRSKITPIQTRPGSVAGTALFITDEPQQAEHLRRALTAPPAVTLVTVGPEAINSSLETIAADKVDVVLLAEGPGLEGLRATVAALMPGRPVVSLGSPTLPLSLVNGKDALRVAQVLRQLIHNRDLAQLRELETRRTKAIVNEMIDAVVTTGSDRRIDLINEAACKMTGLSEPEALGESIGKVLVIFHRETGKSQPDLLRNIGERRHAMAPTSNYAVQHRSGRVIPVEITAVRIPDPELGGWGIAVIFRETFLPRATAERMAHLAQHDYLTGLPNRVLLYDRIAQAIAGTKRNGRSLSLLFIDLDKFKGINDSLGHEAGDQVLQSVAERLRACVRNADTVCRIGGDEFIVLAMGSTAEDYAGLIARKILKTLTRPFQVGQHKILIGASIGISQSPVDGTDADALIHKADLAMYRAKLSGPNGYQFFVPPENIHEPASAPRPSFDGRDGKPAATGAIEDHKNPRAGANTNGGKPHAC